MAKEHKLTYANPGEILALSSILLLEENSSRVKLDIPTDIRMKMFDLLKDIYQKQSLPTTAEEMCRRCAKISRDQNKEALEDAIDDVYDDLRASLSPLEKKVLGKVQRVWNHITENWRTSFDDDKVIEDTHVHHSLHPILRPFFPDAPGRTIDWANKTSNASALRKANEDGQGHKLSVPNGSVSGRPGPNFRIDLDYSQYKF